MARWYLTPAADVWVITDWSRWVALCQSWISSIADESELAPRKISTASGGEPWRYHAAKRVASILRAACNVARASAAS